jgi:hypothetical protein
MREMRERDERESGQKRKGRLDWCHVTCGVSEVSSTPFDFLMFGSAEALSLLELPLDAFDLSSPSPPPPPAAPATGGGIKKISLVRCLCVAISASLLSISTRSKYFLSSNSFFCFCNLQRVIIKRERERGDDQTWPLSPPFVVAVS